jgi:hypothetical protein
MRREYVHSVARNSNQRKGVRYIVPAIVFMLRVVWLLKAISEKPRYLLGYFLLDVTLAICRHLGGESYLIEQWEFPILLPAYSGRG